MGCKSNQFEGQIAAEKLCYSGFVPVSKFDDAEYYILNSCSVTHKSDNEAMYLLRHAHSCGKKTVLTGCIAQIEKEKLLAEPYIDYVVGNEDKFKLPEILNSDKNYSVTDLSDKKDFCKVSLDNTSKTRISLKIQDGCDNRCSYCIIPFGRGKSRSADKNFITDEINRYARSGYKEVVLTGIHIGLWGKDIGSDLTELLKMIEEKTEIHRYRLGSLNPLEITDEMLNLLETSEKFCPHFHISLQSGCNDTLKRMNRHYSIEYSLDKIEDIYSRFERPFIGSDIIAGFAGETEKEFNTTVENLNKSKLSQIHTFPYSIRQGTIAEKLSGHLDDRIKEERASIIKEISAGKFQEFLKSNIGHKAEVLIEKRPDKKTGLYKGVTRNYINVLLENGEFNTIKTVILTELSSNMLLGRG